MASCTTSPDHGPTRDGYRDQRMPVQLRPRVHITPDEAAGAIPATQTHATVPRTGTQLCEG